MSDTTQLAPVAATAANGRRLIDTKAMINILNKRKTVTVNHVGHQIVLTVQGDGQFLPKGFQSATATGITENQFDRTIYNLQANSQLSMLRKENKTILADALKAESAGDMQAAHDLFNDYLNGVQISFSVIEPSSRRFASGDMVTAVVDRVVSKAGLDQIVVNDVRYKAPVNIAAVKFELSDLLDIAGTAVI